MSKDTLGILKRVILCDFAIILLSLIISVICFREYAALIIIGIITAAVNFLLNAVITNYAMEATGGAILIVVGALLRVAIAGGVMLLLYDGKTMNVIACLSGYSMHYVSMVIATTVKRKSKEGR